MKDSTIQALCLWFGLPQVEVKLQRWGWDGWGARGEDEIRMLNGREHGGARREEDLKGRRAQGRRALNE